MPERNFRAARLIGLAIAASGLAHFVSPQVIEPVAKQLFPNNTRRYVYANGVIEIALGLLLRARRSRRVAALGLIGYAIYLAANAIRNR